MFRRTPLRRCAAVAALAAVLLVPATAQAGWRDAVGTVGGALGTGFTWGVDLLVVRPLGLIGVVVGAGAMVPAAFLTAPNGLDGLQEASELLIETPVRYVFLRPVGDL